MQKIVSYVVIFLIVLGVIYVLSYFKMLDMSTRYYQQATKNLASTNYAAALKGAKMEDEELGYVYNGGFQQVVEIWRSDYAWPKPDIYELAKQQVSNVIASIDIDSGMEIFNRYNKKDREYLGQILLQVASLYAQKGDKQNAQITLVTIMENFPLEKSVIASASNALANLGK